jgi:hypothetical protein
MLCQMRRASRDYRQQSRRPPDSHFQTRLLPDFQSRGRISGRRKDEWPPFHLHALLATGGMARPCHGESVLGVLAEVRFHSSSLAVSSRLPLPEPPSCRIALSNSASPFVPLPPPCWKATKPNSSTSWPLAPTCFSPHPFARNSARLRLLAPEAHSLAIRLFLQSLMLISPPASRLFPVHRHGRTRHRTVPASQKKPTSHAGCHRR